MSHLQESCPHLLPIIIFFCYFIQCNIATSFEIQRLFFFLYLQAAAIISMEKSYVYLWPCVHTAVCPQVPRAKGDSFLNAWSLKKKCISLPYISYTGLSAWHSILRIWMQELILHSLYKLFFGAIAFNFPKEQFILMIRTENTVTL